MIFVSMIHLPKSLIPQLVFVYFIICCRRSNSAEEDGVSLFSQRRDENNPPALSFPISSDKDLYSLGDSQSVQGGQQTTQIDQSASDNKMSDIDRLILENLKICENPYASSRKPSTSTHPNYSNPFL
ncbi:hypothetical protein RF11_07196 [Thelohanellus kitauei]|uniref:Uncharacterized protein n=1 Tax=Thelohanellus kitauei TaxID=669202 RepID=A0A0C2M0C4_THEKT|nr:hypothetical protein RF11_07196 [Thelohanellus kitauei]